MAHPERFELEPIRGTVERLRDLGSFRSSLFICIHILFQAHGYSNKIFMSLLLKALLLAGAVCAVTPVQAQMPFYTDDPEVTAPGTLHFEFFNEFDGLQSSEFPNLRQNT